MFNKHQLIAAIALVSLFLLAASVLAVVLNHHRKPRMDGSEDVTEKLRVTSSTKKPFRLNAHQKTEITVWIQENVFVWQILQW